MQYCSAVPASKFVPYSETLTSRCEGNGHSYCEIFLSKASPGAEQTDEWQFLPPMLKSENMFHSRNHMWITHHEDSTCHVGVDGFLAKVLRNVEKLSFVTSKGVNYPTAVLTVRGVDLQLVFPRVIHLTGINSYLRARPAAVTSQPYTLGWLFEGIVSKRKSAKKSTERNGDLIDREHTQEWLQGESKRLTRYVRNTIVPAKSGEFVTLTDGGVFSEDLIAHLTRDEILGLYNEFFSPTVTMASEECSHSG